jgi:hypothetical protein
MRVRIDDAAARAELAFDLHKVGCETRARSPVLDVTHHESPADPLELRLFLRAWSERHPDAHLRLVA